MPPAAGALKFVCPTGFIDWLVSGGVDPLLIGSVLHRVSLGSGVRLGASSAGYLLRIRSRRLNGHLPAPGSFPRLL